MSPLLPRIYTSQKRQLLFPEGFHHTRKLSPAHLLRSDLVPGVQMSPPQRSGFTSSPSWESAGLPSLKRYLFSQRQPRRLFSCLSPAQKKSHIPNPQRLDLQRAFGYSSLTARVHVYRCASRNSMSLLVETGSCCTNPGIQQRAGLTAAGAQKVRTSGGGGGGGVEQKFPRGVHPVVLSHWMAAQ